MSVPSFRRDGTIEGGNEDVISTSRGYFEFCFTKLCANSTTPGRYEERVKRVTQAFLKGNVFCSNETSPILKR